LQFLNTYNRVVFADFGAQFVQKVVASICYTGMDALDDCFRFLPVAAEFCFAAHCLLRFA